MVCIEDGTICEFWGALRLCQIVDDMSYWATRILKPQISMYIDQWRSRRMAGLRSKPSGDESVSSLGENVEQEEREFSLPTASDLAEIDRLASIIREIISPSYQRQINADLPLPTKGASERQKPRSPPRPTPTRNSKRSNNQPIVPTLSQFESLSPNGVVESRSKRTGRRRSSRLSNRQGTESSQSTPATDKSLAAAATGEAADINASFHDLSLGSGDSCNTASTTPQSTVIISSSDTDARSDSTTRKASSYFPNSAKASVRPTTRPSSSSESSTVSSRLDTPPSESLKPKIGATITPASRNKGKATPAPHTPSRMNTKETTPANLAPTPNGYKDNKRVKTGPMLLRYEMGN